MFYPHAEIYYISPHGDNANTGLDTDHPWRTFEHAFTEVWTDTEPVVLRLINGPMHLGIGRDNALPWYDVLQNESRRPDLTIEGYPGLQTITGIDSRFILTNWSAPVGEDYYERVWPQNQIFNFPALPDTNAQGDTLWYADSVDVEPSYPTIPFDGSFLKHREFVGYVYNNQGSFEYGSYVMYPEQFVDEGDPDENTWSVNVRFPFQDKRIRIHADVPFVTFTDTTVYKWYTPRLQTLFNFHEVNSITLKNLRFTLTSPYQGEPAVQIKLCSNVRIDNCHFDYNGGRGLTITKCIAGFDEVNMEYYCDPEVSEDSPSVLITNSTFNHNGTYGLFAQDCVGMGIFDCDISYNNWRAYRSKRMDHDCGGSKLHRVHDVCVEDVSFHENQGVGLWFDQDAHNISINSINSSNNYSGGLIIEMSEENILIQGGMLAQNGQKPDTNSVAFWFPGDLGLTVAGQVLVQGLHIDENHAGQKATPIRIGGMHRDGGLIICSENTINRAMGAIIFVECTIERHTGSFPFISFHPGISDTNRCAFFTANLLYGGNSWNTGGVWEDDLPYDIQSRIDHCEGVLPTPWRPPYPYPHVFE
ncbi:right-handed parallel beta-helix repeat-containing protein [bacterium]|nr:right-handed parallel beta-helix repeat-containing protein [bacterium]